MPDWAGYVIGAVIAAGAVGFILASLLWPLVKRWRE